jgi:pyruvate,water dikinase
MVNEQARKQLGGKGAHLTALREMGMPVPDFIVLPVGQAPDDNFIHRIFASLGNQPLAVRSSAVGEDSAGASFAGQFDTFLNVQGHDALLVAARKCIESVSSERVLAYCRRQGISAEQIQMAVVVQEMFPATVAGIMFTADPADPGSGRILISAAWGLGEGAVSGAADTDSYSVNGAIVETQINDKLRMVAALDDGGTQTCDVPLNKRKARCLSDGKVRELAGLGRQLEEHFGAPQDVEWALDHRGSIAILQTRPITAISTQQGRVYTWDNSNIVESYCGVTSPLTYTFARNAYEVVYRQFCEVMGVTDAQINENAAVFKSMIGLIRGRIFYRLDSWYRVLLLLPGAKYNKRFMEQMMGVQKKAELGGKAGPGGKLRIFYLAWRMVRALAGLGSRTRKFKALFAEVYQKYHTMDLEQRTPVELVDIYRDCEQRLLCNWKAPIINDFFAMIFFGLLKKGAPELHNELLCGEPGMESTLPTRETMKMAEVIRENASLHHAFAQYDDAGILEHVIGSGHSDYEPLRQWLTRYLDRYGDRCMEELKLETATLRDDPTFVIAMLRNYFNRPDLTIQALEEREQAVRGQAERDFKPGFGRGWFWKWVLRRTRRHVRERENLRFARTRVFGLVRRIFRSIGEHLVRGGLLDSVDAVFYLTVDELLGAVEGTTATADLRAVAAVRRTEYQRYREAAAPADRFETKGAVHVGNSFVSTESESTYDGPVLHGLGCAPGVVVEQARVIHSPSSNLNLQGQILVCERTDPGWVPLFPTAGALAVERGSALSHSAIVAREFGIPTVVGIPGLLKRVKDGQWLELDGKTGTIRLDAKGNG